jgi:hypothetical protein
VDKPAPGGDRITALTEEFGARESHESLDAFMFADVLTSASDASKHGRCANTLRLHECTQHGLAFVRVSQISL